MPGAARWGKRGRRTVFNCRVVFSPNYGYGLDEFMQGFRTATDTWNAAKNAHGQPATVDGEVLAVLVDR
jgi:hypothetical protein